MHRIRSLYLVNKHGSLLYQVDIEESKTSSNDKIRAASLFHSISAIASKVSPGAGRRNIELPFLLPSAIQQVSTSSFTMFCKQTLTGLKLILIVDSGFSERAAYDILSLVYAAYSDFVLKDPFYSVDMPVRCSLFDKAVRQTLVVIVE